MFPVNSHTGDGSDGDNYEKYTDSEWGNNEEKIRPSLLFNFRNKQPSQVTEKLASYLVVIFCIVSVAFGLFLKFAEDELGDGKAWAIVLTVIFVIIMSLLLISLGCQPQNQAIITFKVPLVPFLPGISIFINSFLMLRLPTPTWYRFAIWKFLGFLLYFTYGIRHSSVNGHHDNISLHTFKPLPSTDTDELLDDSDAEITFFVDGDGE